MQLHPSRILLPACDTIIPSFHLQTHLHSFPSHAAAPPDIPEQSLFPLHLLSTCLPIPESKFTVCDTMCANPRRKHLGWAALRIKQALADRWQLNVQAALIDDVDDEIELRMFTFLTPKVTGWLICNFMNWRFLLSSTQGAIFIFFAGRIEEIKGNIDEVCFMKHVSNTDWKNVITYIFNMCQLWVFPIT